ncbi:MAG TPA: phage recombination protein Bet [Candidatus Nanopelagicaceae bacterium]|nr:phage recombination protein Bet [Candidatus Nanopelagicaceae bacterium]
MPQSTELATAARFTPSDLKLLREMVARETTDQEFALFVAYAKRVNLDPFLHQIWAVKRWDSKLQRKVMTAQVGIDGMRSIAHRSGEYLGREGPLWTDDGEHWVKVWLKDTPPQAAMVSVMRKGYDSPFASVATWKQAAQKDREGNLTNFWQSMPALMLAKVAEAQGLRAAFSDQMSGLYIEEEGGFVLSDDAKLPEGKRSQEPEPSKVVVVDAGPTPPPPPPPPERKLPETEKEAIAYLWNELPKERRPAVEVMTEYFKHGGGEEGNGRMVQIAFLIVLHRGVCGEDDPHLTREVLLMGDAIPPASEAVPEQSGDAGGQGDEYGQGA